jgi:putative PEP-CTERM system histidine kinase
MRDDDEFRLRAARALPAAAGRAPLDARFVALLEQSSSRPRLLSGAAGDVPRWILDSSEVWVAVPLVRQDLIGLVLLGLSAGSVLHREDAELLEIGAMHVASALLADERARRMAEGRRFEELSRGMAFIAHDLRNVANELALTLANARRHIEKPEFQRDLLISMEDSVASMQRLLDKVAQRRAAAATGAPVDLAEALRSTVGRRRGAATRIDFKAPMDGELTVACDFDRVSSACGHLIQNAIDAAGPDGRVVVSLAREGGDALLEVRDDGPGMDGQELADRLRHPFQSTKERGFGIGLFECREFAREIGGDLEFETSPGKGTSAMLRLPLAPTPERRKRRGAD